MVCLTSLKPLKPQAEETQQPPSLRARLAARHALALLDSASSETAQEFADALDEAVGCALTPAKRALLLASLAPFDSTAAARRLTPRQAREIASGRRASHAAAETPTSVGEDDSAGARLTLAHLDAMLDEMWYMCVQWLLDSEGYSVERLPGGGASPVWRGEQRGRTSEGEGGHAPVIIASAVRLADGAPLDEEHVRRAAAGAAGEPDVRALLITTAEATVGALLEARRLGVDLIERLGIERRLSALETAFQREQTEAQAQAYARAEAAEAARDRLLAALEAAEAALVGVEMSTAQGSQPLSGRARIKKAAIEAREARKLAAQALFAWETLMDEWLAAFGERPARDGSLALLAAPSLYGELADRSEHLSHALLLAIQRLAGTNPDGELGYGAWRQAIAEELLLRIQALRWRAQSLDPARWRDFNAARDDEALQAATQATNEANHANTRAEKAFAQLAPRIGLT